MHWSLTFKGAATAAFVLLLAAPAWAASTQPAKMNQLRQAAEAMKAEAAAIYKAEAQANAASRPTPQYAHPNYANMSDAAKNLAKEQNIQQGLSDQFKHLAEEIQVYVHAGEATQGAAAAAGGAVLIVATGGAVAAGAAGGGSLLTAIGVGSSSVVAGTMRLDATAQGMQANASGNQQAKRLADLASARADTAEKVAIAANVIGTGVSLVGFKALNNVDKVSGVSSIWSALDYQYNNGQINRAAEKIRSGISPGQRQSDMGRLQTVLSGVAKGAPKTPQASAPKAQPSKPRCLCR